MTSAHTLMSYSWKLGTYSIATLLQVAATSFLFLAGATAGRCADTLIGPFDFNRSSQLSENFYTLLGSLSVNSAGQLVDTTTGSGLATWVYDTVPDVTPSNAGFQDFTVSVKFTPSGNNDSFGIYFYNGGNRDSALLAVFNVNNSGTNDIIRYFRGASMRSGVVGTQVGSTATMTSGGYVAGKTYLATLTVRRTGTNSAAATYVISDPMHEVADFSASQNFTGLASLSGEIGFRCNMCAAGSTYIDNISGLNYVTNFNFSSASQFSGNFYAPVGNLAVNAEKLQHSATGSAGAIWIYDPIPDTTSTKDGYQDFTASSSFKLSGNNDSFGIYFYNGGVRASALLALFNVNNSGSNDVIRFFSSSSMLTTAGGAGVQVGTTSTLSSGGFTAGQTYQATLKVTHTGTTSATATLTISDPAHVLADFSATQTFSGLSAIKGEVGFRSNMNAAGTAYFDDVTIVDTSIYPPENLYVVESGTSTAIVSWTQSLGATSYKIYRDGVLKGTSMGLNYSDAGVLNPYCSYEYTVVACDATGGTSAASAPFVFAYHRFGFTVPWDDAASNQATDMSGLSTTSASQRITVVDGHLSASGVPIKLFGVNMSWKACYPPHDDPIYGDIAEKIAAHLAKLGVNCVRLHHTDDITPMGFLNADGTTLNAGQMDKFDYFISRLKAHGIYVDLSLQVARLYPGFSAQGMPGGIFSGVDLYYPGLVQAQKDFASMFLSHVNPYTGMTYASDPVVALLEINNENGLLYAWHARVFEAGISSEYLTELKAQWNTWLQAKYSTTAALSTAWTPSTGSSYGTAMITNGTFAAPFAAPWVFQRVSPAVATSNLISACAPDGSNALQMTISTAASDAWKVQAYQTGRTVVQGQAYTVTFWAKANSARSMMVGLVQDHAPFSTLGGTTVQLSTDWQQYNAVIITNASDTNARLQFGDLASVTGDVWLANVSMQTGNTALGVRSSWVEGALSADMLSNGDFAWGFVSPWSLAAVAPATASAQVVSGAGLPAGVNQALEVNVTATDTSNTWKVGVCQNTLTVTKNVPYTIGFWAKSEATRSAVIGMQQESTWKHMAAEVPFQLTPAWKYYTYIVPATDSASDVQLYFSNLANMCGKVWLAQISMKQGTPGIGLPAGETLGAVNILNKSEFWQRSRMARKDWINFLWDTEQNYWNCMRTYVKTTLNSQSLLLGTQTRYSPAPIQASLDVVDDHAYWQHPQFPNAAWDTDDWYILNQSMAGESTGGEFSQTAMTRAIGKPAVCTEFNFCAPYTYSAETMLLMSAYATMQGWDALFVYDYQHGNAWQQGFFNKWFQVGFEPVKLVTMPAAASIMRCGSVATGITVAKTQMTTSDIMESVGTTWPLSASTLGMDYRASLTQAVGVCTASATQMVSPVILATATNLASSTGELEWDTANKVVTIHTGKIKAVIGATSGTQFDLGDGVMVTPGTTMQPGNWCSISITLKSGSGFTTLGSRFLITATGYTDNHGMLWKSGMGPTDAKSSVGLNWGKAPSLVEGIDASVVLPLTAAKVKVWALDGCGQRTHAVSVADVSGKATFNLSRNALTIWYEVESQP